MTRQAPLRDLNWTDLKHFLALVRAKTIPAAAASLGVNPSTTLRRLRSLETTLGFPLFEKDNQRYELTNEGHEIAEIAREMESRSHLISMKAASLTSKLSGKVRVACTDGVGFGLLMPLARQFRYLHPGIDLDLLCAERNVDLSRREADLAIRHGQPKEGNLISRKLADYALYFYASKSYLSRTKLDRYEFVTSGELNAHLPGATYAREHIHSPKVIIRTNSISAKLAAVRSGLGIVHLPRYLAQNEPELVRVDLGAPPFKRPMWLVMHADMRDIPRIRATADFLADAIIKRRKQLA